MPPSRIDALKMMLEADPSNAFARYGIAMEFKNAGEWEKSADEFDRLLEANPDYVAAYFHGGQVRERLGDLDAARSIYRRGIESCLRTGDSHTLAEIQVALDLL